MGRDQAVSPPSFVTAAGTPVSVEGRFGRGLRFDGKAALRADGPGFSDAAGSLACWLRLPDGLVLEFIQAVPARAVHDALAVNARQAE